VVTVYWLLTGSQLNASQSSFSKSQSKRLVTKMDVETAAYVL